MVGLTHSERCLTYNQRAVKHGDAKRSSMVDILSKLSE